MSLDNIVSKLQRYERTAKSGIEYARVNSLAARKSGVMKNAKGLNEV